MTLASGTVLCFGEVLLRLSAPGRGHLLQQASLDAHFGGAEANVAVALARLGVPAALATVLPAGPLGDAAIEAVRGAGVDVSHITRAPGRLGLYFLSPPSGLRSAEITYDRLGSAYALASPDAFDWRAMLEGATWLHVSGITAAIGPDAVRLTLNAVSAARDGGVRVSFDVNYRASMWARWCDDPVPLLAEHVARADLLIGNHRDLGLLLAREVDGDASGARRDAALLAFDRFPNLRWIAGTNRRVLDADRHVLTGRIDTPDDFFETEPVEITGIVDRIGTGDAYVAGVLASLDSGLKAAARAGIMLAALKHGTPGDTSRATKAELDACTGLAGDVRR